MDIQVNQFSYNFSDSKVSSAQVGLYGQLADSSEYVNASIRVNAEDLPNDKDFMSVSMQDMIEIARQKLAKETNVTPVVQPAQ